MAVSQSNFYKNQRRNQAKILTREAIFINEYVQTKYKDIYREAANLYNEINKKYPQKPDLRKTTETTPQQISSVTQEGDQTMDPSILDQISPEVVEKIIRELQLDPELKDMMDDVQQEINTEEELVGLEIDLPELDDLIEEELQMW